MIDLYYRGMCNSCFHELNSLIIDESEFKKLREAFLNPVLIGKDIFYKSKPEEFKSFINFLERIEHTDIVLDGLNIALSPTHRKYNLQLSAGVVIFYKCLTILSIMFILFFTMKYYFIFSYVMLLSISLIVLRKLWFWEENI